MRAKEKSIGYPPLRPSDNNRVKLRHFLEQEVNNIGGGPN